MTLTANSWRTETPGDAGWERSAKPGAANKYFMVSADCHVNEPFDWLDSRIEEPYKHRIPHIETRDGNQYLITEGWRPQLLRTTEAKGRMEDEDVARSQAGSDPAQRLADLDADGVDVEIAFPNKGLLLFASPDPVFVSAMARAWNRWAHETFSAYSRRILPMACISPGDREGAEAEIKWAAENGFKGLALPCKPVWGGHDTDQLNYNLPEFDWMWELISDVELPMTFHVSTGRDPRASKGNGGAVINYVVHSLSPTMEPMANLCASGVLERFPKLRFATIEAGIGWIPWALDAMDEAYRKHHFWVRPKLAHLPSDYFRMHGYASFQEDPVGLELIEDHGLTENMMWANDYPHHEGSWPHSAAAIERQMGHLADATRSNVLGLNAARLFDLDPSESLIGWRP